MFKTLLRTLSALSIVTITASAGFAQSTGDTDCDAPWNQNHEDCTVSTKIWLDGFTPSIKSIGATNGADNGFVEFGAKGFKNAEGTLILGGNSVREKLNLKVDVVKDNGKTVKKTIGGVLFYRDVHMASSSYLYYAGIKSGTNLGRPLTNALAGASWTKDWTGGKFKAVGGRDYYNVDEDDFTLNVIFNGGTGTISALVQQAGQAHYRIAGEFDSKGVITGTVTYGLFDISRSKTTPHSDSGLVDGTLSGLIGDQGAVGVFVSDTNRDSYGVYGFAGGFVVNSHFDAAEAALLRRCAADPFDSGCSDEKFAARKIARIEHCVTDNNWVSDGDCFSALIATGSTTGDRVSCISNPFQTACKDANADYASQYMTARADRVTFCVDSANSGSAVCTVITVADVCGVNPFGAVCAGDYDEAANNRLIECQQDGVADGTQCAHADTIIDVCELAPFEDECTWGAFDDERKELIATCHDGGECAAAVLELPNAATWANSFKTGDNPKGLGDAVADTTSSSSWMRASWDGDPERHFLKNIKGVLPSEMVTAEYVPPIYTSSGWIINYRSMNLKTAEFSIDGTATDLGGDVADGVATLFARNNYPYVGIFSTTDLGAPLTTPLAGEPKTASWVGSFQAGIVHHSGDWGYQWSLEDFVLEVNFDDQSIEAFVIIDEYYTNLVKGKYDDSGVISGDVYRSTGSHTRQRMLDRYSSGSSNSYPLTGLIGKEGAVGVFAEHLYGGKFVARPADLVELVVDENTKKTAETFLNETCRADPFHKFCYLSDEREARIKLCSTGDNVLNASIEGTNTNCVAAAKRESCILHPFNVGCTPTAGSHYELVRKNRSDFCGNPDSTGDNFDTLCTGAEGTEHIKLCFYDPFNRICLKQDDAFCANDPDHLYCGNAVYDNVRKVVCKAGSSHESCATKPYSPSSNVTAASWLYSFYEDNGAFLPIKPYSYGLLNQFLQGTEDGLDNGDVEIRTTDDHSGQLLHGDLNLDTATFDGLELGRDKDKKGREAAADDGVAYFRIHNFTAYAGIFSGTDLGAPLMRPTEDPDMTVKWYGQFQAGIDLKTDFTLEIDFNGESTGTVKAFVYQDYYYSNNRYHLLSGKFDENGVISGTVVTGDFANHDRDDTTVPNYRRGTATLTGLIGAEGAVGVFVGGNYYGGFVASSKSAADAFDPNVKTSDWVRSFGNTPPLPDRIGYNYRRGYNYNEPRHQTRFLQGTETGLDIGYSSTVSIPQTLTLADVRTDREAADGVAYVFGWYGRFAGILSGTNLGAALPTVPAGANGAITAIWDGKLGLIAGGSEIPKRDIDLTVDFTNNKISYSGAVDGAHFVNLNANWESGVGYDGVLKGTITYNPGAALDNLAADSTKNSAGIVSGIIGQQGAVGAFRSTHVDNPTPTHTSFAGGFVAVPEVNYVNWVHSFGATGLPATANLAAPKNQFLQNGVATLRDSELDSELVATPINRLNGNATSSDTTNPITLSGEATDGVAFAKRTREVTSDQTDYYYYAELSSTTDMGRPLFQASRRATANGVFQFVDGKTVHNSAKFELKILFDGNGSGSINAFIDGTYDYNAFYLTGKFDVNGVIKGDITHNSHLAFDRSNQDGHGILTGLIGKQGTVGAFISDATGADGYAGGFVADPHQTETSIDYLDWAVRSFDTPLAVNADTDAPKNQFLHGKKNKLSVTGFDTPLSDLLTLAGTTPDGTSLDGEAADGVAFFRGTLDDTSGVAKNYYYAGLLSGTNLGEPIIDNSLNGSWKGSFGSIDIDGNKRTVDFTLNVSFGDAGHNQAGSVNARIPGDYVFDWFYLAGKFDVNGVIRGDVYHNSYIYRTYDPSNLNHQKNHGTLTGLIGQDGAVGAFISDEVDVKKPYAGGFVAAPPAEPASP